MTRYTDLQVAIDAASGGDTLRITGTCIGNFDVPFDLTSLKLVGKPTAKYPTPTLDGGGSGTVLDASAGKTFIRNLKITGGNQTGGVAGGIIHGNGVLVLLGSTSITSNSAAQGGGGIYNDGGILKIFDSVSITNNSVTGDDFGGGIKNTSGRVKLFGSATISGNTVASSGDQSGGGIFNLNSSDPNAIAASSNWVGSVSGNSPDDCEPDIVLNGVSCT